MKASLPVRILVHAILNIALVWVLSAFLHEYVAITGGIGAYVTIGALLTLLNLFIRPILSLITTPLRLLATLLTFILVNAAFLGLIHTVTAIMDPAILTFRIEGGIGGWLVIAIVLGVVNWGMKHMMRKV